MSISVTKNRSLTNISVLVLSLAVLLIGVQKAYSRTDKIPLWDESRAIPDFKFYDESNSAVSLENWLGKVVVLNIWATWCAPCRIEMPTLDRLQRELGGEKFEVVALSIDEAGVGVVRKFFDEIKVENLDIYIDSTFQSAEKLKALGLPATILIGPKGRELGRWVGPAEWDKPEMLSFFKEIISAQF